MQLLVDARGEFLQSKSPVMDDNDEFIGEGSPHEEPPSPPSHFAGPGTSGSGGGSTSSVLACFRGRGRGRPTRTRSQGRRSSWIPFGDSSSSLSNLSTIADSSNRHLASLLASKDGLAELLAAYPSEGVSRSPRVLLRRNEGRAAARGREPEAPED